MIEIEIDGKKLTAREGQMVIDVADENDIYIPRFCYHKKLSIAANCRMCLVEVEKSGKPLPACATPVTAEMKVKTKSKMALAAQRSVMEFLLINHPLDCPICDQGGECELQDISMGFGEDVSRYNDGKRVVLDEDLGSLIATDMTRCIHCTRCVRFGTEIAGMRELGMTGRGEESRIGTYVKHAVQSEVSGNIIDVCPVGALTSKPYRFKARSWEMHQHSSIAPHDCVGSNIYVHTRSREYTDHREVLRVVPRENESINETWISDRDRFSYEAFEHDDKLSMPLMKKEGKWIPVDWQIALNVIVDAVNKIQKANGDDALAGLISPSATLEEHYLFQKLLRGRNSNHVDHRIRHLDFSQQNNMPITPRFDVPLDNIHEQQAILLVGSDVRREQPIVNVQIRKAFIEGAEISCVNALDYDFNYDVAHKHIVAAHEIENALKNILDGKDDIFKSLSENDNAVIFMGAYAQHHPKAHNIQALCEQIADKTNAKICVLTDGANSFGAWATGCVPHRGVAAENIATAGDDAQAMFANKKSAYFLFNVEPELDCANAKQAISALQEADFVVSFSPFRGGMREDYADIILPITSFAENSGTYINGAGQWQSFKPVGPAYGEARPGWKVLRVLGNLLELSGFEYVCSNEIRDEVKKKIDAVSAKPSSLNVESNTLKDLSAYVFHEWSMYSVDHVTRRAKALQATPSASLPQFGISQSYAAELGVEDGGSITVSQGDQELTLPFSIDERLHDKMILVPAGIKATAGFGLSFTACDVKVV